MKRLATLIIIVSLALSRCNLSAQDIPFFSQKLTNSFLLNPALAGKDIGSIAYSHKKSFSSVIDAPESNFVSIGLPFLASRLGTGLAVFQEDVNFIRNTFVTSAFSYHIKMKKESSFSIGVSGEYDRIGLTGEPNFATNDPLLDRLRQGVESHYDFSFGLHYQNARFQIGAAVNRISSGWLTQTTSASLSRYYSLYSQWIIPCSKSIRLLPYVAYHSLSASNHFADIGIFARMYDKIIVGTGVKNADVLSLSTSYKIKPFLWIGYTQDFYAAREINVLGPSNEIIIRSDFITKQKQKRVCYGLEWTDKKRKNLYRSPHKRLRTKE